MIKKCTPGDNLKFTTQRGNLLFQDPNKRTTTLIEYFETPVDYSTSEIEVTLMEWRENNVHALLGNVTIPTDVLISDPIENWFELRSESGSIAGEVLLRL